MWLVHRDCGTAFLLERPDGRCVREAPAAELRGSGPSPPTSTSSTRGRSWAPSARGARGLDSLIAARDGESGARGAPASAGHGSQGPGLSCVDKAHARHRRTPTTRSSGRGPSTRRRVYDYNERAAERTTGFRGSASAPRRLRARRFWSSGGGGVQRRAARLTCRSGSRAAPGRRTTSARAASFFFSPRRWRELHAIDATSPTVAPIAGGRTSRRPGPRPGAILRGGRAAEETTGLLARPREEAGKRALLRRRLRRLPDAERRGRRDAGLPPRRRAVWWPRPRRSRATLFGGISGSTRTRARRAGYAD